MIELPKKYAADMRELLQQEFQDYLEAFEKPVRLGLRINTNKISTEEWERIAPFPLRKIPWIPNGYYYREEDRPSRHPYYYAGLYYLQEPSAMTPASRLPIEKGDKVLDLCAAPGGKATELGARLGGTGILAANDISNSRAKALLKNLELFGIGNTYVISEDPGKLEQRLPVFFDKILVDAPCSGEGMFHRKPEMMKDWEEKGPKVYSETQKKILQSAVNMLKPGGMLLYSTCTFSEAENEDVVRWALENNRDLMLSEMEPFEGFEPGRNLKECIRIFPHKMGGEGHFLALFKKEHLEGVKELKSDSPKSRELPKEAEAFLAGVKKDFPSGCFQMIQDKVYYLPKDAVLPLKLRYLRTGLYLGEWKKNRFEPSQALAMCLSAGEYDSVLSFAPEDERVIRYLKGETLQVSDLTPARDGGWQLVCVNGYPLGWGKLTRGILKNKYYAGWRWQ